MHVNELGWQVRAVANLSGVLSCICESKGAMKAAKKPSASANSPSCQRHPDLPDSDSSSEVWHSARRARCSGVERAWNRRVLSQFRLQG
jgi:hypothetical protein